MRHYRTPASRKRKAEEPLVEDHGDEEELVKPLEHKKHKGRKYLTRLTLATNFPDN